uniref:Uncharacterized protein n=1 Tax=Picea sitchensis TaxID=3332 RepID=D5A914_PICSI|nr:unknown [Picea sitchensis]
MGNTSNNQNGADDIAENVHVSNHGRVNTNQPTNEAREWDSILTLRQCSVEKGTRGAGRTSQ